MPIKRKKNYLDNKTEFKTLFTKNKIKNRSLFFSNKFLKTDFSSTLDERDEKNLSEDFQIYKNKKKEEKNKSVDIKIYGNDKKKEIANKKREDKNKSMDFANYGKTKKMDKKSAYLKIFEKNKKKKIEKRILKMLLNSKKKEQAKNFQNEKKNVEKKKKLEEEQKFTLNNIIKMDFLNKSENCSSKNKISKDPYKKNLALIKTKNIRTNSLKKKNKKLEKKLTSRKNFFSNNTEDKINTKNFFSNNLEKKVNTKNKKSSSIHKKIYSSRISITNKISNNKFLNKKNNHEKKKRIKNIENQFVKLLSALEEFENKDFVNLIKTKSTLKNVLNDFKLKVDKI